VFSGSISGCAPEVLPTVSDSVQTFRLSERLSLTTEVVGGRRGSAPGALERSAGLIAV